MIAYLFSVLSWGVFVESFCPATDTFLWLFTVVAPFVVSLEFSVLESEDWEAADKLPWPHSTQSFPSMHWVRVWGRMFTHSGLCRNKLILPPHASRFIWLRVCDFLGLLFNPINSQSRKSGFRRCIFPNSITFHSAIWYSEIYFIPG